MEDIVVLLLETWVINEAAFSKELKLKVIDIFNRCGLAQAQRVRIAMEVDQDRGEMMAPPQTQKCLGKKANGV